VKHIFKLKLATLKILDKLFPPDISAFMDAKEQSNHELTKALGSMGYYLDQLEKRQIDCLDFGCGWGGETIWLSERVKSATGIDIDANSIDEARRRLSTKPGIENCNFVHYDGRRLPFGDDTFDAAFSTDVFEHVPNLLQSLREIHRVLRPNGVLVSRFGPLFYSPQGYHLYWACQVPYAHLLFGLKPILSLRNERTQGAATASTWQDMGLNKITVRDFKMSSTKAGFEIEKMQTIPVKNIPILPKVPVIGNLFVFGLDVRLKKKANVASVS
jgi:ubiquinone/menaquinone biosynthesis C-methylase UbiE